LFGLLDLGAALPLFVIDLALDRFLDALAKVVGSIASSSQQSLPKRRTNHS
jgi:hypothetical protein